MRKSEEKGNLPLRKTMRGIIPFLVKKPSCGAVLSDSSAPIPLESKIQICSANPTFALSASPVENTISDSQ